MVRFLLLCHVFIGFALFGRSAAIGDEPTPVAIMNVRGRSAGDLAKVAADVLEGEKVKVTVDSTSNLLIVKGSEDDVKRVSRLLQALDPPPQGVSLQFQISVSDPDNAEFKAVEDTLHLETISNGRAVVDFTKQTPTKESGETSARSQNTGRRESRLAGMTVEARPKVSGSGVVTDVTVEKRWFEGDADYSFTLQATLYLKTGKPQEITTTVSGDGGRRKAVITVTANLDSRLEPVKNAKLDRAGPKRPSTDVDGEPKNRKSVGRSAPRSSGPNPQTLFDRLDADGDGEVSAEEREGVMGRFLERLGFAADDEITPEAIGEKMRQLQEERAARPEN